MIGQDFLGNETSNEKILFYISNLFIRVQTLLCRLRYYHWNILYKGVINQPLIISA